VNKLLNLLSTYCSLKKIILSIVIILNETCGSLSIRSNFFFVLDQRFVNRVIERRSSALDVDLVFLSLVSGK